jgi:hypothetical protein
MRDQTLKGERMKCLARRPISRRLLIGSALFAVSGGPLACRPALLHENDHPPPAVGPAAGPSFKAGPREDAPLARTTDPGEPRNPGDTRRDAPTTGPAEPAEPSPARDSGEDDRPPENAGAAESPFKTGDTLVITMTGYEGPGLDTVITVNVDARGRIRLPGGQFVEADGASRTELARRIIRALDGQPDKVEIKKATSAADPDGLG